MAFGNGVLMRGPHYWAWAREDGTVMDRPVRTLLERHRCFRLPVIRSAVSFAEMIGLMVSMHARNGKWRAARLLLWIALWLATDFLLNIVLIHLLGAGMVEDAVLGVIDFGLFLLVLREGMGKEVWRYHGAEHKAVNAYEHGADLRDLRAVATYSRVHNRCGTNLVIIMGALMVLGYVAIVALPAAGVLSSLFAVVALISARELFRLVTRRPASAVSRVVLAGGKALQRCVTTREPGPEHLELACAALNRVLDLEAQHPWGETAGKS